MNHDRINYTQVVWEITCLLQEADSLEAALRTSLEEVVKAVDAEAGTIWFYNAAGDKRIYPSFWIGGADLTGLSLSNGEGIAGSVVKESKTVIVRDCQSDERWAGRFDEATGFVTRSMICVPLTSKYETIGCIQIINKNDGSLYSDDDVSLAETLAMLTAIAIDNKGLHLGFTETKSKVISLCDATVTQGQGEWAVTPFDHVSFDILEGELLVILCASDRTGASLADIIAATEKPTSGTFLFDGKDMTDADEAALTEFRRKVVGRVFPSPNLIPTLTVKENLTMIADRCKKPMNAEQVLETLGLLAYKDCKPDMLNDASRQCVSIARAMIKKPRVIVANEPTATLDPVGSTIVLSAIETVASDGGTVVLITHSEEIAKMANRVIRIKGGTVSEVTVNRHPLKAKEIVP